MKNELPILRQLQFDFPGTEFDYIGTYLIVNGRRIHTFLSPDELALHDPVKPGSRSYYQLFCNIVYNRLHIKPEPGSYADLLIIDEEEARKAAIAGWFEEKRIAFLEEDGEVTAVSYELEEDPVPKKHIEYEEASDLEPLYNEGKEKAREPEKPKRSNEEQKRWESEIKKLEEEGERIKAEMMSGSGEEKENPEKKGRKWKLFRRNS